MVEIKKILRAALGPLLPIVRSARSLPARRRAGSAGDVLRPVADIAVCYLTGNFPKRPPLRAEIAHGGAIKLTALAEAFPHTYPRASLLYVVSSLDHPGKAEIVRTAKKRGVKIVINQNGVAYPGWHGPGWQLPNQKQRACYELADFVIYQSNFCQISAEKYLGKIDVPSAVLYNPVDLDFFVPAKNRHRHDEPVLMLGGNQFSAYRFESAAHILQKLLTSLPGARLVVTGNLWGENQASALRQALTLAGRLGIRENLQFTGPYSQETARTLFQGADILLHTQFQDASPGLIGEALATGLPVVYSASGGTPELISLEAGIGIPVEPSWDRINLPDPQDMARALLHVWDQHPRYAEAARQCAVERFNLLSYTQNHRAIFSQLLE
jgi:glycosyltransferase involved in cell wall biosynthesis